MRARTSSPALRCTLAFLALAMACGLAQARFRQPNEEYQARRAKLRATLDGPVVLFGYTGIEDASEVAVFFQEPYFYYLTGHDEPGAALLLIPDPHGTKSSEGPREILYLPARDLKQEQWEGPKLGADTPGIAEKTGFQAVEPFNSLPGDLRNLAKKYPEFYTLLPPDREKGYPHLTNWSQWLRAELPKSKLRDAAPELGAMRQVKSAGELALLQRAVDLSVDAHLDAMKRLRPGLFEYQVAARMKEIHEMGGCAREAYAPVVGTGFNSTVLHYSALNDEIKDGDVVLIDVAGEYGGYAADITRTLPANGKFTPRQREIYDIVLGAQSAALAAIKPGAVLFGGSGSLQQIAADYINTHGHDKEGRALGRYFIHGLGHHVGLDVHDPGEPAHPLDPGRVLALEPGMVITIEPGIYIPEENLGVRIEDEVLITKDGYQLLTARLPRSADEIEHIMAAARATPQP